MPEPQAYAVIERATRKIAFIRVFQGDELDMPMYVEDWIGQYKGTMWEAQRLYLRHELLD